MDIFLITNGNYKSIKMINILHKEIAIAKRFLKGSVYGKIRNWRFLSTAGAFQLGLPLGNTIWQVSKKFSMLSPCNLAILLLGPYLQETSTETCALIFIGL